MRPLVRKFALTVHLVGSVGWIGAVLAYLALDVAAMTSNDPQQVAAAWTAMELTGWYVIVPLAIASLVTGIIMSLGTPWGLFRYYWVLISLVLTIFATVVLIAHMPDVSAQAQMARQTDGAAAHVSGRGSGRGDLLHAGGGLIVLLVIATLNVYKPQGMTRYGWRQRYGGRDDHARQTPTR